MHNDTTHIQNTEYFIHPISGKLECHLAHKKNNNPQTRHPLTQISVPAPGPPTGPSTTPGSASECRQYLTVFQTTSSQTLTPNFEKLNLRKYSILAINHYN